MPAWNLSSSGLPSREHCIEIKELCNSLQPDLIHVWGVENYFSSLVPTFNFSQPLLLEIQGLFQSCAEVYYGDLSFYESLKCLGLREILFPFKSIYAEKRVMLHKGQSESEKIRQYKFISTQSQWVRDFINNISTATLFKTGMSLRRVFLESRKWEYPSDQSNINFYCSAASAVPYKSMQTILKAFALILKNYPHARLYVIGNFRKSNWITRQKSFPAKKYLNHCSPTKSLVKSVFQKWPSVGLKSTKPI